MTHFNMVSVVLVLSATPSARPPSGPRLFSDRLESEQSNGCHMSHFNVVSVVLVLRASPSARPPSGLISLPCRLERGEQSNGCHMTHSNVVSVVLVLRASPSARPPSGPSFLPPSLEIVSIPTRVAWHVACVSFCYRSHCIQEFSSNRCKVYGAD